MKNAQKVENKLMLEGGEGDGALCKPPYITLQNKCTQ
jgi:hypothetical protein